MENEKKSSGKKKKHSHEEKGPSLAQMTSRNEKELVNARKAFYSQAKVNEKHLKLGDDLGKHKKYQIKNLNIKIFFTAKKGIPLVIIGFSLCYWTYGLYFYINPGF